MAMSNRERVGRGFELLAEGLSDFVDDVMTRTSGRSEWNVDLARFDAQKHGDTKLRQLSKGDVQVQLRVLTEQAGKFRDELSRADIASAQILREVRNDWAHTQPIDADTAQRALDLMAQLLKAVDARDAAAGVRRILDDARAQVTADRTRHAAERIHENLGAGSSLKPWRDVLRPHDDVARGNFRASEFAADLFSVAHPQDAEETASVEYTDPKAFFERTFVTVGLADLLGRATARISGDRNASPVINLQTNFGGGKTHSMLALYHLFSGKAVTEYPQRVQEIVAANGAPQLETLDVRRVAIVGTQLSASKATTYGGRPGIRTIWGELAWQLGGSEAYALVAEDDQHATNPGAALRTLLQQYSPCLILIDEWVAYARQLFGRDDLPAGTFETQFTFAQSLTEAAAATPGAMLVVSVPASDAGEHATDEEIGGRNGQAALERLQNIVRRNADQWQPANKDESFEIVRRRLFQDLSGAAENDIAAIARAYVRFYAENHGTFPVEAEQQSYEERIVHSYPFHPELLDRLYEDWSTLPRFQRTRGVLNLLSHVVHALWESADTSPLINAGNVSLSDSAVNSSLAQYIDDAWKSIIDADIDGTSATSRQIDKDRPNLGQHHVALRTARAIFLATAPHAGQSHHGIDRAQLALGIATPDDNLGNFGGATDLLAQRATYFYGEDGQFWFDTEASVTKTAQGYAQQLFAQTDVLDEEVRRRLGPGRRAQSLFESVHVMPADSADVPDDDHLRLVILGPQTPYAKKGAGSSTGTALDVAKEFVEKRGSAQRLNRNRIVLAAPAEGPVTALLEAVAVHLAWQRVVENAESLNLTPSRLRQARRELDRTNRTVDDRLAESYQWVLFPEQDTPNLPLEMSVERVSVTGEASLPQAVGERLKRRDGIVTEYSPDIFGTELNESFSSILDERGYVSVGELWTYYSRFPYLSRLASRDVFDNMLLAARSSVLVGGERFALAQQWKPDDTEAASGRFLGLLVPPVSTSDSAPFQISDTTLIVRYDLAEAQADRDAAAAAQQTDAVRAPQQLGGVGVNNSGESATTSSQDPVNSAGACAGAGASADQREAELPHRFYGSVLLPADVYGRRFTEVSREIIDYLVSQGTDVEISIDIQARRAAGFSEGDVRTLSENARTLKFESAGFEA